MQRTPQKAHFSVPSINAWELKAESELGVSPADHPFLNLGNGRSISPYYKKLYLKNHHLKEIQDAQKKMPGFKSLAPLSQGAAKDQHLHLLAERGINGLVVNLDIFDSASETDILSTLSLPSSLPVFFQLKNQEFAKWQALLKNNLRSGGWAIDPVVQWMCGQAPYEPILTEISPYITNISQEAHFTAIELAGFRFFRAGATPMLEISLIIATLVVYLDYFTERGITAEQVLSKITISIQVGSLYLTEIAKLRALRTLIVRIGRHYDVPEHCINPYIIGSCSLPNKIIHEPFENLVRMSSEAMSLIVGGCDAVIMHPFTNDKAINQTTASSLPQNIPLMFQYEAMLDQVADPAAGSYLLETVTFELVEGAWNQFLEIEEKGGLILYYLSGEMKNRLDDSWESNLNPSKDHNHMTEDESANKRTCRMVDTYFLPDRFAGSSDGITTSNSNPL